jgi:ketosteroid isomerase-like protein
VSQRNVEIVKEIFAAWGRGDAEAGQALLHPEVEFEPRDAGFPGLASTYRGRSGAMEMMRTIASEVELELHADWFIPSGDHVVVGIRLKGRGRASGAPFAERVGVVVYTFREGLVIRMAGFRTLAAAATALGI